MPYNELLGVGYEPKPEPRIYNKNDQFITLTTAGTYTYEITVLKRGKIQGFLAMVTSLNSSSPVANTITVYLKRNGNLVSSGVMTSNGIDNYYLGPFFVETLNVLSGADVEQGDKFTLEFVKSGSSASTWDIAMTLVVQEY